MEPEDIDAGAGLLAMSQVFDRALVVDVCAGELSCEAELDRADKAAAAIRVLGCRKPMTNAPRMRRRLARDNCCWMVVVVWERRWVLLVY